MRFALFFTLTLTSLSLAISATIYVPDNYATIQNAINASSNGDIVIVRSGTYMENISFVGKAITLKSEMGFGSTVIDGGQASSVIQFMNEEGPGSVLDGFTITNGKANRGGGIYCYVFTSPTITNNLIIKNIAQQPIEESRGGGIHLNGASPTISNNYISYNNADFGSGICYGNNSRGTISGNYISENGKSTSDRRGGGIMLEEYSRPYLSDNIFKGNAAGYGGGIYATDNCDDRILRCSFIENRAGQRGGGLYTYGCRPPVKQCEFSGNVSSYYGGAIHIENGDLAISQCIFFNNSATNRGGALYNKGASQIINCTFYGNSSTSGGAMFNEDNPSLINCILWNNIPDEIKDSSNSSIVSHCCVLNGWPGIGNFSTDPLIVDPVAGDFHIYWSSPCRDTGDNLAVWDSCDFEDDPRTAQDIVDVGADEFYYHLYHTGDVLPGATIELKVTGNPSSPIRLFLGTGIQDPPLGTQYGDLYIQWPPLWSTSIGMIPGDGLLKLPVKVPGVWSTGSSHPLQALVGPLGGGTTTLTNLMSLTVE